MAESTVAQAAVPTLPELEAVYWRPRVTERSLRRSGGWWTLTTVAHTVPFVAAGVILSVLKPVTIPVALILFAHAWLIPELYASRGANVMRRKPPSADPIAEQVAEALLGSLLDSSGQQLYADTGTVIQRGTLGVWLLAEGGAILVRPGGRRAIAYCVKASGKDLPRADRVTHLLLALRSDEAGFATLANLSFSGATWRLRRRLERSMRPGLAQAVAIAGGEPRC